MTMTLVDGIEQEREFEEQQRQAEEAARLAELEVRRKALGDLTDREIFGIMRRRASIKQQDVARVAGTTQSYLSAWESGRWVPPDRRTRAYWDALDTLLAQQLVSEG